MALPFCKLSKLEKIFLAILVFALLTLAIMWSLLPPVRDKSEPTPTLMWTEVFQGRKMYVLGDSTVASGNFNMTDHPYGIDLKDGVRPSGRFSNGYTLADYLAMKIGSPIPPAHVSLTEEMREKQIGINFASGGCGILSTTQLLNSCRTLDAQILDLSNQRPWSADLENSLFFLSVGSNDFIDKPKLNVMDLVSNFMRQLETLYSWGARLFLINNVGPIGCIPNKREQPASDGAFPACDQGLNQNAQEYSKLLGDALRNQKSGHLVNATIVLANSEKMLNQFLTTPADYGFTAPVYQPCCGEWNPLARMFMCSNSSEVCDPRTKFLFFDGAHITEKANKLFVDHCFSGSVCYEITN